MFENVAPSRLVAQVSLWKKQVGLALMNKSEG